MWRSTAGVPCRCLRVDSDALRAAPAPDPGPLPRRPAVVAAGTLPGWASSERLICPAGHTIRRRDHLISGSLIARCHCGRAVLILAAIAPLTVEHPVYLVEVGEAEVAWLRRARPSVFEVLELLGLLKGGLPTRG